MFYLDVPFMCIYALVSIINNTIQYNVLPVSGNSCGGTPRGNCSELSCLEVCVGPVRNLLIPNLRVCLIDQISDRP